MYTGGGMWGVHDPLSPPELRLGEAMAYNDMNLGMVGHVTPDGIDLTPAAQRYIAFFHAHAQDLAATESLADVAVLRSFASVEFNPAHSLLSSFLFEQTLIQTRTPFAIISDRFLKDLGKYKVLILANQDALSDDQISAIREFVRAGGGLVATEETSLRDGWRRERPAFGMADLFGFDRPGPAARRSFGKGRVAYLPHVVPATTPPPPTMSYYLGDEHWKLPANYAELAEAVKWAAGGELTLTVQAPLSVTAGTPALRLDALAIAAGEMTADQVGAWVIEKTAARPCLVYSSADPSVVRAVQERLGAQRAGAVVEALLADVGRMLLANGFARFLIAGGETSGAVVGALGVTALRIGPEIDPGVPWTRSIGAPDVALALKSGNFGAPDFFLRAWTLLAESAAEPPPTTPTGYHAGRNR